MLLDGWVGDESYVGAAMGLLGDDGYGFELSDSLESVQGYAQ